jgi:hypothetical protein
VTETVLLICFILSLLLIIIAYQVALCCIFIRLKRLQIDEKRLRAIISLEMNKALTSSMINYARTVVNMLWGNIND